MTDKEIIINGIDVSECYGYVHNAKEYDCGETYSKFHYRYCEENPNCYYKQLKRKEQENKKLKEDEKSLLNIIDNLQKEKNKWVEKYNDLGQDFDQLKQTLIEIKEIAEVEIECKTYEIKNDYFNEIRWKALNEHIDFTKQILQKISEYEVEND